MKIFAKEQLSPHKFKTKEGYLICTDAILARTGKQTYRKGTFFPNAKDADIEIEVDRPEKEVCDATAVASFENKPICLDHPDVDVNSENYKQLAVGFVRDVTIKDMDGQKVMTGNLVITDANAIAAIESGQYGELSCGYDCEVLDEDNPAMTHIRGNHVALCEQGRAGIAKIRDSVKDTSRTITTQCYILSRDGKQILTQERPGPSWPGIAVPGGHVRANETALEGCVREVREETGLEVRQLRLFGTYQYECEEDGPSLALLYTTFDYYGDLQVNSDEGLNKWYPVEEVLKSPKCAEGFQDILSKCINGTGVFDSVKDEWQYIDCKDLDEVAKLSAFCSKHNCHIAAKTPINSGYKCRIEGLFDECHYVRDRWSMYKFRGEALDSVKDVDPKEDETKEDFISRFMSETKSEYPDEKQRLAIAYSYWDKKHGKDCNDSIWGYIVSYTSGPGRTYYVADPKELIGQATKNAEAAHIFSSENEAKQAKRKLESYLSSNAYVSIKPIKDSVKDDFTDKDAAWVLANEGHKEVVKDANSYLVTSKRYENDAMKEGFNVESYGDTIRVWGPRWKLDEWKRSYDADEEVHYAVIKDSIVKDDKFDDLCEMLDNAGIDYSDAGYNPSMFWFTSKTEFDKAKVLLEKKHSLRTAINKHGHYVIEVKDSVVKDDAKQQLISVLGVLRDTWQLKAEGKTWTGRKHFEFETKEQVKDFRATMMIVDRAIERFDNAFHCVSTFNGVLLNDGRINLVVDVDDRHYHDSVKSAKSAVDAIKTVKSVKLSNFQSKK